MTVPVDPQATPPAALSHEQALPLLPAAALNELDGELRAALVAHVGECALCQSEMQALRQVLSALHEELHRPPEPSLSPARLQALELALRPDEPPPPPPARAARRARPRLGLMQGVIGRAGQAALKAFGEPPRFGHAVWQWGVILLIVVFVAVFVGLFSMPVLSKKRESVGRVDHLGDDGTMAQVMQDSDSGQSEDRISEQNYTTADGVSPIMSPTPEFARERDRRDNADMKPKSAPAPASRPQPAEPMPEPSATPRPVTPSAPVPGTPPPPVLAPAKPSAPKPNDPRGHELADHDVPGDRLAAPDAPKRQKQLPTGESSLSRRENFKRPAGEPMPPINGTPPGQWRSEAFKDKEAKLAEHGAFAGLAPSGGGAGVGGGVANGPASGLGYDRPSLAITNGTKDTLDLLTSTTTSGRTATSGLVGGKESRESEGRASGWADEDNGRATDELTKKLEISGRLSAEGGEGKKLDDQLAGDALPAADPKPVEELEVDNEELPPVPAQPPGPVNPFVLTQKDALSTFALESEAASYRLAQRFIRRGYLPPPGLVRMEEFINAFEYYDAPPAKGTFAVHASAAPSPFGKGLALLRVAVKARVAGRDRGQPMHLVLLVDSSGSMNRPDRLPVIQDGLATLVRGSLSPEDRVTLIAFDDHPQLLLEAEAERKAQLLPAALAALSCQGSTNIQSALKAATELALRHHRPGQLTRVLICSDGVATVGPETLAPLLGQVKDLRRQGISLSTVGVGAGNYDDEILEQFANQGDGKYLYLDSRARARQAFGAEFRANMDYVAQDVKLQVAFNPQAVRRYRLIGYENRAVRDEDFRNDTVDAGEIGSGQTATALYELELLPVAPDGPDPELGTVYLRYKDLPDGVIREQETRMPRALLRPRAVSEAPRFYLAAVAAEFAELLRQSEHAHDGSLERLESLSMLVANALPGDPAVSELLRTIRQAQGLPVAK